MDTAQWPQEIVVKPMEEIIGNTNSTSKSNSVERKARPQKEQAVNCPRCNSTNTKFCYYNNYSLSQPRYFCKTCKRYWTEGGSLRNIPVGGCSRKNKKSPLISNNNISNSSSNLVNPLKKLPDLVQNPSKIHIDGSQDLNLGFSSDFKTINELIQVPNYDSNNNKDMNSPSTISPLPPQTSSSSASSSQLSAMELINGITSSRGLSHHNSFMHMPIMSGFSMPSLNFSLDDGLGTTSAYENHHHLQETTNGRFLFPFVGLKQVQSTTTAAEGTTQHQHNDRDHSNGESTTNGYWNGMLGGGGSW